MLKSLHRPDEPGLEMTMQTFEIKNRWNGQVLFSAGGETLRGVVMQAVRERAYLSGAYLRGAYLRGADLIGAYLSGADLSGADLSGADGKKLTLVGQRPVLIIGPIGSRCDYMTAHLTDVGVYVRAGCFFDTLTAFAAAVQGEHDKNEHGREYTAAITMIEAHASIWTPTVSVAEAA